MPILVQYLGTFTDYVNDREILNSCHNLLTPYPVQFEI